MNVLFLEKGFKKTNLNKNECFVFSDLENGETDLSRVSFLNFLN
jgi:hypothetical protein